jgi:hypothetical protein
MWNELEPKTYRRFFSVSSLKMATRTGFEPVISGVTGQRIGPTMLTCHILAGASRLELETYGIKTRCSTN